MLLTTPFYSAYVRIGEGCSNRCTFCAIPLIRGPYRSRNEESILQEVQNLASRGVKEYILVAQDTTRWGTDHGGHTQLPSLMKKIAAIPGVDWLRVLYCYPDETSDELLDLLANTPNICPYLDIPIQHINSDILKRMHRLGTREDIIRCVEGAKKRGLMVRTTLITGFPGETEEQFRELLDFVKEAASRGILCEFRLWNQGGLDSRNQEILTFLHRAFPDPWQESRNGQKLGDRVWLDPGERFDWPELELEEVRQTGFCYGLRDQIGILCDGTVVPCCLDHNGDIPLGNLFEQELREILESPRARAVYEGFSGRKVVEPLCKRCGYATRFQK